MRAPKSSLILFILCLFILPVQAQQVEPLYETRLQRNTVSPAGAMLRSFVMPGWGQLSLGSEFAGRGVIHLGIEATLLTSYTWLYFNSRALENNMYTHVNRYAGIDISGRSRSFQLAVAAHNSLAAYNEFQERSRQWNEILDDTELNRWEWQSEKNRIDFQELRNRRDRNRQQLPAIVTLMVVNRVISGVHAFMSARQATDMIPEVSLTLPDHGEYTGYHGLQATISFRF